MIMVIIWKKLFIVKQPSKTSLNYPVATSALEQTERV